jgi:hypothetical protein
MPLDTALAVTLRQATALADSMEALLRPFPLMRPEEEAALRRYTNETHLRTASRLGIRPTHAAAVDTLVQQGSLVPLEDSSQYWVLREMTASTPNVTPDTRALLQEIGRRFQDRLGALGLPALRFEVSSALRSTADQAMLLEQNANAAPRSAHAYGTTVDIPYSAYAAPAALPPGVVGRAGLASGSHAVAELDRVARVIVERSAARKSRELKAILAAVLRDVQSEGLVLVTLERQQPVFHITVARRM